MKLAIGLLLTTVAVAHADDQPSPDWAVAEHSTFVPIERQYGDAKSMEVGASVGMMVMGHLSASVSPSVGYFLTDHVELSGILSMTHVADGSRSANYVTALFEPSVHLPISGDIQGFGGLGFGVNEMANVGFGLAFAPRIGANIPIGDHGMFVPSLSMELMTHGVDNGIMTTTSMAQPNAPTALRVNVGYAQTF